MTSGFLSSKISFNAFDRLNMWPVPMSVIIVSALFLVGIVFCFIKLCFIKYTAIDDYNEDELSTEYKLIKRRKRLY